MLKQTLFFADSLVSVYDLPKTLILPVNIAIKTTNTTKTIAAMTIVVKERLSDFFFIIY